MVWVDNGETMHSADDVHFMTLTWRNDRSTCIHTHMKWYTCLQVHLKHRMLFHHHRLVMTH